MKFLGEDRCLCGSGKKSAECCVPAKNAGENLEATIQDFAEGEVFMLYRQLGDMRRQMKSLVSGRSHQDASVEPEVDRRLVVFGPPLDAARLPTWNGHRLTRELVAYPGQKWDDEKGAVVQEKLYMLSEAFGDYLIETLQVDPERVTDFEAVVESFGDFLLMYYMITPLDVKPGYQAIRRYLGNYYPRTFMDANIDTIYTALTALPAYYAYLCRLGLVNRRVAESVLAECADWPWYRRRFEEYQVVVGKARSRWCREFDYKSLPLG
jgi:hypothetical protein